MTDVDAEVRMQNVDKVKKLKVQKKEKLKALLLKGV